MKKIKWMLVIVLIVSTAVAHSQVTNKDEMVKKIFTTLQSHDEQGFVKLFPGATAMKDFFMASAPKDKSMKDEELTAFMNMMNDSTLQEEYGQEFKKAIKKGEKNGVDWTQARFVSHTSDSLQADEDGMKLTTLKGKIYFNVNEKEYYLQYKDVIWFEGKGWYGVSVRRVDEKKNESLADNTPDYDDDEMGVDSVAYSEPAAMDTVVAPKVKPVQKQKTKQPAKPQPKTKTQTSAKKPE